MHNYEVWIVLLKAMGEMGGTTKFGTEFPALSSCDISQFAELMPSALAAPTTGADGKNILPPFDALHQSAAAAAKPPPLPPRTFKKLQTDANYKTSMSLLHLSPWFWGSLSHDEAKIILKKTKIGTFVIRESSQNCATTPTLALTVQTRRGPTSVRILYQNDNFHLDCEEGFAIPRFRTIHELLAHYASTSRFPSKSYFIEPDGRQDTQLFISKPLLRTVPELKHICRTVINKYTNCTPADRLKLPLSDSLKSFLLDYPFQE